MRHARSPQRRMPSRGGGATAAVEVMRAVTGGDEEATRGMTAITGGNGG